MSTEKGEWEKTFDEELIYGEDQTDDGDDVTVFYETPTEIKAVIAKILTAERDRLVKEVEAKALWEDREGTCRQVVYLADVINLLKGE